MRNLDRSLAIFGGIAAASLASAALVIGCSGDDSGRSDGGDAGDAASDNSVPNDVQNPDVQNPDTGPADGGNPYDNYRHQVADAFCKRMASCCGIIDGGPFDDNSCQKALLGTGWGSTNEGLAYPGVMDRGHLKLDSTSAQSCLAALSTISCPTVTSAEYKSISATCNTAVVGTQATGGDCVASIECKPTDYCYLDTDAGLTDAGVAIGKCTTLLDSGVACGQGHYGDPNFSSEECAYKEGPNPPMFCNYDNFPNNKNYFCAPLRQNGQLCYFANECQSNLCTDQSKPGLFNCDFGNCTCATSWNFGRFTCEIFQAKPKDAGTD